ncbi:MAG TPA: c-type cytochrome [Vicinamibacterales bacterium]|nr:c-type cytochrome [Vicinamibacterales bacterium]
MAEKKGVGHAYNVDFLNVVFAASSIFLLLSTVWMVWDDYDRDWKNTQRRFARLQYDVTRAQYRAARDKVDRTKLGQLQSQLKGAEQNAKANQSKVDELQNKVDDIVIRLDRAGRDYQYMKATYDHDRYDFESARAEGKSNAAKKGETVADEAKQLHDLDLNVQKLTAERNEAQKNLNQYIGQIGTLQKAIEDARAEQMRLRKVAEAQAPSPAKDYFLNAPLLDFMAPTIKINQLILPDVVDDVNFKTVPKMDRCTTCHLGIDNVAFEKYPQPFKTHPKLDAYLGSKSPHPIDRIGCTVCHDGMGQSVSFKDASHTPTGEKQKLAWEEKYGWEEPHEWDYPMLPTKMTEASCAKCHKQEIYIPNAPALNVAYATFERAGCYACHKTRGFENVKKPGPILTKIDSKLTKDWVKTWIRNPRAVKQTTWMPRIWYNSNSSSPQDAVRNEVEINAAVNYLFANTEKWEPPVKNPKTGDAKAGEKIVKSIGCQGCHVVGEGSREQAGPHRTFGQPLENIGAKTTYEWVFNWVRDPKHYNANTYMPNLRLTDAQAADVATYLMTLKGAGGDQPKATYTQKDVDDTLLDYYTALMPAEEAKAAVAKLNDDQKQIDLGQKVINRYGCFSCHDIKGFEKTQSIGTDLSEEGSKLVTRLDFGFVTDIPHTAKIGWFDRKLHNPREFDKGRVLQPLDKLRMPNFDLSEIEVERLLTAIMSFQRDTQPIQAFPAKSARRDYTVAGRTTVHRRNCVGCHIIEDDGGDFLKLVSDSSLGPPRLTPEGARVQPDWLYAFLRGPIQIRPWIDVRMPTFGLDDPNLNGVIHYFQAVSNNLEPFRTYDVASTDSGVGKALFEKLQCQKCHVLGEIPKDQPTANLAPDLRMVHDRLNPDWLLPWLKNPASFLPGTRMTQFWPDYPKSPYPELGGDADAQMRAIIQHLQSLRGGPTPRKSGNERGATAATN